MTSTDGHVLYCIGNGLIVVLTENDCGTLQPLPMSSAKVCVKAHLPGLPDRHLDARRRVHQRRLGSEDLAVGVDVDGGGAGSATGATGGLGLNVGISGVAEEMMGSIYRSLKALQNKSHERHSILKEKVDGMGWDGTELTRPIRNLLVRPDVQPLQPFSACEPSTAYRAVVDIFPWLSILSDANVVRDAEQLA